MKIQKIISQLESELQLHSKLKDRGKEARWNQKNDKEVIEEVIEGTYEIEGHTIKEVEVSYVTFLSNASVKTL